MDEKLNFKYNGELMKFVGRECEVVDQFGLKHEGTCCAVNVSHANFVLATKDEKILIKNVVSVRRKRDKSWEAEKNEGRK